MDEKIDKEYAEKKAAHDKMAYELAEHMSDASFEIDCKLAVLADAIVGCMERGKEGFLDKKECDEAAAYFRNSIEDIRSIVNGWAEHINAEEMKEVQENIQKAS